MKKTINSHLSREEIIKNGSFFTPNCLVTLVFNKLKNYIDDDCVIADFGSGYGSFIKKFNNYGKKFFGTEIDKKSYEFLCRNFPNTKFYNENSLENINRKKYNIDDRDNLIIVGNPPYNDITSIYKKGFKGSLICDQDVHSRDLGIAFLKAYCKLNAKYICILHPLAYLIKKQNFTMLGEFRKNYKLIDATIFSSKAFATIKKSNSDFPVVAALYEKNSNGMGFEYIQNFKFKILKSKKFFCLNLISTIDNKIQKYPKANMNCKLQFYTLRDINALMRNTSFIEGPKYNGIDINIKNLYQYAWLYFFKNNFKPKNSFLYGNLSPLYSPKIEKKEFKNILVSYAYNECNLISKHFSKEQIEKEYGPLTNDYKFIFKELKTLYLF